ncbi:hypothetical protein B5M09_008298, partial [Aphanomyces astaci]
MASADEKMDLSKRKIPRKTLNEQLPTRTRSRGKEKPVDVATSASTRSDGVTPPRSRSTPGKERTSSSLLNAPPRTFSTALSSAKLLPVEQEQQLQAMLTSNRFEDAATWISGSTYLSEKYQLADVVRLVLDNRQFDLAGRLIREHKLAENQQLVTYFVMELVRSGRFHLAVRYAQELVPHFNAPVVDPSTRPMWTPSTLVKAMIRVQQYKPALKYTLQFHLEGEFPVKKFVQGMLHEKTWLDAFTVILEHKLETAFSLDNLIDNLLGEQQWSAAIKCVKMAKRTAVYTGPVLVRHMIQSGDFLSTLHYLKAFDLTGDVALVRHMLDFMCRYGELYKALKYSVKFGLAAEPAYDPRRLIDMAIDRRQFHVAQLYIKRLKLDDLYQDDLRHIAHEKDHLAASFRALMAEKRQRQLSPDVQARMQACLGDLYEPPSDEERDVVVSVHEQVFAKKQPKETTPSSLLERLRQFKVDDKQQLPSGGSRVFLTSFPAQNAFHSEGTLDQSFADVDRAFASPSPPPASPPLPPPPLP